ncbi:SigB/SigF/SigG family RNA polymerase sigma factor [Conexibacter woesei]|uniref:RNA polymerase, sigma 28 subunit, Sig B/F/G subfamily n=1 Tax=Conexibacter woesei (strain DSM 14684 / CCUG 47730 / CIP 108061 / JCM 11494 / NBRC 100937 / ID131577) TaxID=469383 RepID=D3F264_CONWI|nr:SigB/SigF/SigG family RNA polymerase sigma factor [Conexibacter woesei]ADB50239.1 RNA polymerase, sigma 28 subunit, Sig B/F/G subfamily [Conexibacter woesei DSM 14684]
MSATAVRPRVDAAAADEHELLRRWHEERDEDARRALIERMMPLVRSLARRYANRGEPLDDLEQVGCVGLIKAVDRFDLSRELRFSTFAVPTILGEIKRHFRDRAWSVRVSRGLQELSARVTREADRLSTKLGRSPTIEDLAEATNSTPEQVLEALQGAQAYSTVPLEEPLGDDGEPVARIGAEDPEFELAEERIELSRGLHVLSERERRIVLLRFFAGLTQREIAERVGISQMHVSRLLRRSLERMGDTMSPLPPAGR